MALSAPAAVRIQVDPSHTLATFRPAEAIGADIDGHGAGDTDRIFSPRNIGAMRSAGVQSVAYRLRTELGVEAWHWNVQGAWSDPAHERGYWTSSSVPGPSINTSYGYRLPRRGNTIDQANNDGFSRLDDGDPATYWKSNPYLDPALTGGRRLATPQWVVIDFQRPVPIDGLRIKWANPYATRYRVDYWSDGRPFGRWKLFDRGQEYVGRGGEEQRRFGRPEISRYLRIRLLESSHTAEPNPAPDPRDRMGFAIREIQAGVFQGGRLVDAIVHRADNRQTVMWTSSTDPWHRAADRDPNTEQPGFDLIYRSGLTASRPMLVPISALYDTPANSLAEIAWLRRRNYPIRAVEVGEEPDGQCADPETYATLYRHLARQIAARYPTIPVGGPSLEDLHNDGGLPRESSRSWAARFLDRLRKDGALSRLGFFSFEWYPCNSRHRTDEELLQRASTRLAESVGELSKDGLPPGVPWMITEFGYSAYARPAEDDLPGALLNLDVIGKTLSLGGEAAYIYGYEPGTLISERPGEWGNMMMWLQDAHAQAKIPLPMYWAARLLTREWWTGDIRSHAILATEVTGLGPDAPSAAVNAYALRRPDGSISLLVLNESACAPVSLELAMGPRTVAPGRVVQWGPGQYSWRPTCATGCPTRSLPPAEQPSDAPLVLPPFSATVIAIKPPLPL